MRQLSREFMKKSGCSQSEECLVKRIARARRDIAGMEGIEDDAKVKLLFALSASVEMDFYEKLKEHADVALDYQNRIVEYKKKDGERLELEGTHVGNFQVYKKISINSNNSTTDTEHTELFDFLIERTKEVRSPLNISQLAREFKEKSGCFQSVGCLFEKMRTACQEIPEMEGIDDDAKVKLLFALGASIEMDFYEKLREHADVTLDIKNRIVEYKKKEGEGLELGGTRNVVSDPRMMLNFGPIGNKKSVIVPDYTDNNKIDERMMEFLAEKATTLNSLIDDHVFAQEFKAATGATEHIDHLVTRYKFLKSWIHGFPYVDEKTKVLMLLVSSAYVPETFLTVLRRNAQVEVDENNRIIKYIANDGSLDLSGDHSFLPELTEETIGSGNENPVAINSDGYDEDAQFDEEYGEYNMEEFESDSYNPHETGENIDPENLYNEVPISHSVSEMTTDNGIYCDPLIEIYRGLDEAEMRELEENEAAIEKDHSKSDSYLSDLSFNNSYVSKNIGTSREELESGLDYGTYLNRIREDIDPDNICDEVPIRRRTASEMTVDGGIYCDPPTEVYHTLDESEMGEDEENEVELGKEDYPKCDSNYENHPKETEENIDPDYLYDKFPFSHSPSKMTAENHIYCDPSTEIYQTLDESELGEDEENEVELGKEDYPKSDSNYENHPKETGENIKPENLDNEVPFSQSPSEKTAENDICCDPSTESYHILDESEMGEEEEEITCSAQWKNPSSDSKHFDPNSEHTDLYNYLIDRTIDAESPLIIQHLARDFKEMNGTSRSVASVIARIEHARQKICGMEGIDDDTKVRMLFALSVPIDMEFLEKLKENAGVTLDDCNIIVEYKTKGGEGLELRGTHARIQKCVTTPDSDSDVEYDEDGEEHSSEEFESGSGDENHLNGTGEDIVSNSSQLSSKTSSGTENGGTQITEKKTGPESIDLFNYLIERTKDAKSPLIIQHLARDFKKKSGTSRSVASLTARINKARQKICGMEGIDDDTKVKMLFALSVPIDMEFFKKLAEHADVAIDYRNRIVEYKTKGEGGLELRAEHLRVPKYRTTPDSDSDVENDEDSEEDSSEELDSEFDSNNENHLDVPEERMKTENENSRIANNVITRSGRVSTKRVLDANFFWDEDEDFFSDVPPSSKRIRKTTRRFQIS